MKPHNATDLFFVTEEAEAEMVAAGYEFEPPPTACTVRLRDAGGDERWRAGIAAGPAHVPQPRGRV